MHAMHMQILISLHNIAIHQLRSQFHLKMSHHRIRSDYMHVDVSLLVCKSNANVTFIESLNDDNLC